MTLGRATVTIERQ